MNAETGIAWLHGGLGVLTAELDAAYDDVRAGSVAGGLRRASGALARAKSVSDLAAWRGLVSAARSHPIAGIVRQSPLTQRGERCPAGLSDDPIAFDFVCGADEPRRITPLGRAVFAYERQLGTPRSFANRRHVVRSILERRSNALRPQRVLALRSGHCREWDQRLLARYHRDSHLIVSDTTQPLAAVCRRIPDPRLVAISLPSRCRRRIAEFEPSGSFDFAYGTLLIDDLSNHEARAAISAVFAVLKPGAMMIVPSLEPGCGDGAYLETFLNWSFRERTERELFDLCSDLSPIGSVRRVYRNESGPGLYLCVTRCSPD